MNVRWHESVRRQILAATSGPGCGLRTWTLVLLLTSCFVDLWALYVPLSGTSYTSREQPIFSAVAHIFLSCFLVVCLFVLIYTMQTFRALTFNNSRVSERKAETLLSGRCAGVFVLMLSASGLLRHTCWSAGVAKAVFCVSPTISHSHLLLRFCFCFHLSIYWMYLQDSPWQRSSFQLINWSIIYVWVTHRAQMSFRNDRNKTLTLKYWSQHWREGQDRTNITAWSGEKGRKQKQK